MTQDPFAERSARLLAALDFSEESAARERQHRQELTALLHSLLEVADALDRLLAGGDAAVARRTVELLARQLAHCLEGAGVVPLSCLGEVADPEVHEIVGVRGVAAAERDTIVEVLCGGYSWNGLPLRRARVIVAAGDKETSE